MRPLLLLSGFKERISDSQKPWIMRSSTSRPDAGVISVAEAIEKALARKKSKSKSYKDNLGRRWRRFEKRLSPAKRKAIHTVTQLDVRRFLSGYRPENGKGKIFKNFRWKFRAFQKAAGEKWNPWPKDGLRHSYASYHLAKTQHAGLTSESMVD